MVVAQACLANKADSVYLFSYATEKNHSKDGLQFAWSSNLEVWNQIGNGFSFLRCDYGRWDTEKRMIRPYIVLGKNNEWDCVWQVNERDNTFAHASSKDFVYWGRQSYPVTGKSNCIKPVVTFNAAMNNYSVVYRSENNNYYAVNTTDFKSYSLPIMVPASAYKDSTVSIILNGTQASGQIHKVPWAVADKLIKTFEIEQFKKNQREESSAQDNTRFAGLKQIDIKCSLQPAKAKPISDLLLGVFFEDLNYAADGGLYAELVQNRDFEYTMSDKEGHDSSWNNKYSWRLEGEGMSFFIDSLHPVHPNNPHYASLTTKTPGAALINTGFDGIPTKKGEQYNCSLFIKRKEGAGKLLIKLVTTENIVLAQSVINASALSWKQESVQLLANADAFDAHLVIQPQAVGTICLDMISLFPKNTFKERTNGLRKDLAQTIADIHPRFVRFPGGCLAHGDGLANIYRWKNSIGPLETRKPQRNLWGYHQTAGLGYFEYFRFCEDIKAEPVPVIAAAVSCQNSATGGTGQQGGIPIDQMDEYIQDIFDLVEYANGPVTTIWGKKRAAAGHPKPFNLKYIGIGNEDLITDVFEQRYTMIVAAMKEKHPEITVIGTVGPTFEGTDYEEGWKLADKLAIPVVDEHYYQMPGWFVNNQDYYDKYDRSKSKVYLGEYAAHLPGTRNTFETALAEALYLTALERNGDIVTMASYAPLLAKNAHTQWNPDLIYFDNTKVMPTVNYEVQKLYGNNMGSEYLPVDLLVSNNQDAVKKRIALSVVRDKVTQDIIVKMVNLLPAAANVNINLTGINVTGNTAIQTQLSGNPAGTEIKPVISNIPVAGIFDASLPPYSFTILRIKPIKN